MRGKMFRRSSIQLGAPLIEPSDTDLKIQRLVSNITWSIFKFACSSLWQKDKLFLAVTVCFRIQKLFSERENEFNFLTSKPEFSFSDGNSNEEISTGSGVVWLNEQEWGLILRLSRIPELARLSESIVNGSAQWTDWIQLSNPEMVVMPQVIYYTSVGVLASMLKNEARLNLCCVCIYRNGSHLPPFAAFALFVRCGQIAFLPHCFFMCPTRSRHLQAQ
jgi:hypothetical protein